ncbi:MAG: hypothetical protein ABIV25_00385 [Paracoccaceae bacterium]
MTEVKFGLWAGLAVGCLAGAVIALQIGIMRVFAVGSWSHFGSLVVSLAMLGFGVASVLIVLAAEWIDRHWRPLTIWLLLAFGPLAVGANLLAQVLPFNAIFLISDPAQKWRLAENFLLYLLPFLVAALFLGIVFRQGCNQFNRLYFADLIGSGAAGLAVLGAMYVLPPERLLAVPLALWLLALVLWQRGFGGWLKPLASAAFALVTMAAYFAAPSLLNVPDIAVSQYKGVAYARNFPDAKQLYRDVSPFGDLQVYASSYMHFAPGLSDNAAFNVPEIPIGTFVGMYIDGDGPEGIMRALPPEDAKYYNYLPAYYPYVLKRDPKVFVVQFGGGLSTVTALNAGAASVTIAENNPAVLRAFHDPSLAEVTGNILANPKISVVPYDGRLFLAQTADRYDVIDFTLADSVGLSNPGGFAISERYAYTAEAIATYMKALAPGGVLSVTIWNKEEPPKSVLKFYATVAAAARLVGADPAKSFFVSESYLSTTTVLFKDGGLTTDDVAALSKQTTDLSFDEVYSPGFAFYPAAADGILTQYRASVFGDGTTPAGDSATADSTTSDMPIDGAASDVPSTTLARLFWQDLIHGQAENVAGRYVFDNSPLTNDRPYFAAYVRPQDLALTLDRLDILQDDWGYLLLWATLAIAGIAAIALILLPLLLGGQALREQITTAPAAILYFGCLGLGYITVEVGLISDFSRALTNPTISAAIVISGMLVFSGVGSLVSERLPGTARRSLPLLLLAIATVLAVAAAGISPILDAIGTWSYTLRALLCLGLTAPAAFLMGFPMATALNWLARNGQDRLFVWAWGINGCTSVVGAAAVPLIAVTTGLSSVLLLAASAYLLSIPAFLAMSRRR